MHSVSVLKIKQYLQYEIRHIMNSVHMTDYAVMYK